MSRNKIFTSAAAGLALALAAHGQATETTQTPPTPPAVAAPAAPAAALPSVDEIIAKNLAARGGKDQILAKKSARMTGKMASGAGQEFPFILQWKRPNKMRMEFTFQGMTGIQAYDGTTGWMVMPFMGKKDPEAMSADDLKDVEDQADFDGELVDYAGEGPQGRARRQGAGRGHRGLQAQADQEERRRQLPSTSTPSPSSSSSARARRKIRGQEVEFETAHRRLQGGRRPAPAALDRDQAQGRAARPDHHHRQGRAGRRTSPTTAFVMPAAQAGRGKEGRQLIS